MFTVFTLKNSVCVTGLVLAIVLTFPRSHTVREALVNWNTGPLIPSA